MIVITGAAGFIGSCLISKLNKEGHENLILVDDFSQLQKIDNYHTKNFIHKIERSHFLEWFEEHAPEVNFVYHIGARTDTTEFNVELFNELNLNYTKSIWNTCTKHFIPLVYASSAATYGLGEFGYDDDESKINLLKPLNPYGDSKNDFDKWAITQKTCPPKWAGFKFFNVYGPNEYHKGRMASVIFHSFNQINEKGQVKLFRSHNPNYTDGGQLRDFVYVKDLVDVLYFTYGENIKNGIYNLGSGKARTFLDLAKATFKALGKEPNIEFIDTPIDIRDKYQYFTEANMSKLIAQGYKKPFTSLEDGVKDYVSNYLIGKKYL
ncbi:MAG: ADP-glyceromanno-heptose 6-epimerase [Sphingobacteriaceae bacterium]|nr:ADP-glyceromanno-heptose 6-epimerase [Sphingobacteriaceae bacterium]